MMTIPPDIFLPYTEPQNNHLWVLWPLFAWISFWLLFAFKSKFRESLIWSRGRKRASSHNRRKELADWAQSKGLKPNPSAGVKMASRYWQLKCLQRGDEHYAFNVMEGMVNNFKVCTFDYYYETVTSSYGNRLEDRVIHGRYYFSAVVIETDFQLKPMIIHTENIINKIAEYTRLHDINFESMEFNNKFHVKASDRRWAYDVVNQATMELLLNHCRFNIELNGNYVIAYRDDLFSPGYFEEALQLLTGIVDNLPKPLSG
jgi:hypothetical protein